MIRTLHHSNLVATTPLAGNWVATFLPEWRSLRTAFERTLNPFVCAVRIFLQGHAGTVNFRGAFQGLRSLLSRYPLVPVSPKTTRGSFKCFVFSPALCSVVAHKRNYAAKEIPNVGIVLRPTPPPEPDSPASDGDGGLNIKDGVIQP